MGSPDPVRGPSCLVVKNRPMFECDGSERTESAIIFFSFELGYSRRPAAYLSNDVGHPASGLAFGHSVCNKESSASSRTSFTTCHQDGQKLAGYVVQRLPTFPARH